MIDSISAKVGDLQQKLVLLGLRDELVEEFLSVSHLFDNVIFSLMGKQLLEGHEVAYEPLIQKFIHIFWRLYREESNLHLQALGHI